MTASVGFSCSSCRGADLDKAERLSIADLCTVALDVGAALDYAHAQGVIHRDVKPANIHIAMTRDGRVEKATILDFGVAKVISATGLTEISSFVGTLGYASPESIAGDASHSAVDQYSFACTMFELLTGELPYPHATLAALIAAHTNAPIPRISETYPRYLAADPVFARALAKNPGDRYPSCGEFAQALARALRPQSQRRSGDFGVEVKGQDDQRHHSPNQRQRRPIRRTYIRRRAAAGIAVSAVLAAAGVGYLVAHDPTRSVQEQTITGDSFRREMTSPDSGSAEDVGSTWGLAVDPQGRSYAFRDYRTAASLSASAQSRWGYDPRSWVLVSFTSGCAAIAAPMSAPDPVAPGYVAATSFDRPSAQQAAIGQAEQRSGLPSHSVDTLCVGDYIK
ncbi:serine/threonine protein kinase [Gordonia sp. MMO-8]|uniref:serine/threonine protein kinase n=1 Tax=Gordonia sp. MMO-8 TaxID=3127886 RepID=UPI003FA5F44F